MHFLEKKNKENVWVSLSITERVIIKQGYDSFSARKSDGKGKKRFWWVINKKIYILKKMVFFLVLYCGYRACNAWGFHRNIVP